MAWTEKYLWSGATGTGDGSSEANAWTTVAAAITGIGVGPAAVPTRINVKAVAATPYAQTSNSRAFNTAGAATAPVWWRGYKATIGDQDTNLLAVANTDIPQITFTTGQMTITGTCQLFSNIDVNSAITSQVSGAISSSASLLVLSNFRVTNTGVNVNGRALTISGTGTTCVGCYFNSTTTAGMTLNASAQTTFAGCYVVGGIIGIGIFTVGGSAIINCVIDSPAGDGVSTAVGITASNVSIYAPGGNGFALAPTGIFAMTVVNCYVENALTAAKAAYNNTSGGAVCGIRWVGCASYNCTAHISTNQVDYPAFFDIGVLASQGFNNPGSQDFTPKTVLDNAGFPLHFATLSPTNYETPGAYSASSGTAAGILVSQGWQGGFRG